MSALPLANTIGLGEFVDAATAAGSTDAMSQQLARMLFAVGFFTMLTDVATALYKAPSGVVFRSHKLAEVIAAFCLSRYCSSGRVREFARVVLCVSVLPLVGIVALGGFAIVMRS